MAAREEPSVFFPCGRWISLMGALHVIGGVMGNLEQWCESCKEWHPVPKPKRKRKSKSLGKNERPLFL